MPSATLDPTRALRKARRLGLFGALAQVYAVFPETRCRRCGRCCFQSPGLFYVEHLKLLELLSTWPAEQQQDLVRESARELLFAWVEPKRSCLFLDEQHRCSIYEHRPLVCRMFGLVPVPNLAQAQEELRLAAEEEAEGLSRRGIEIPEATLGRALAGCRQVRSVRGRRPKLDQDELAEQVAALDGRLLSREVIIREYCFQSLPDRLGAVLFGSEAVEKLRLQMLRRAQRGEPVETLLEHVLRGVDLSGVLTTARRR